MFCNEQNLKMKKMIDRLLFWLNVYYGCKYNSSKTHYILTFWENIFWVANGTYKNEYLQLQTISNTEYDAVPDMALYWLSALAQFYHYTQWFETIYILSTLQTILYFFLVVCVRNEFLYNNYWQSDLKHYEQWITMILRYESIRYTELKLRLHLSLFICYALVIIIVNEN